MRVRYVLPFLFLVTPAAALDISQPVMDSDNKPVLCLDQVREPEVCSPDRIATLGYYIKMALRQAFADEQNLAPEEKNRIGERRNAILQGLTGANEVKLKIDDAAEVKKVVGKTWPPLIINILWKLLEQ